MLHKREINIKIFLIILAVMPFSYANVDNYNNHDSLQIMLNASSGASPVVTGSGPRLDVVNISLLFSPQNNYMQRIIRETLSATENAEIKKSNNSITFYWTNAEIMDYYFSAGYDIETLNTIIPIERKIRFPLTGLDEDIKKYTEPTEFIDINDGIRKQAAEIAEGQDDYYKVVFELADWVNKNVNYSLTTLTADVVEKSSWVLENKYGVCDELTNLFISMARSLGIPARFVVGTVYSNTGYTFGNHGWAEVYFPGYGWVPFDVTFAQYGWVDPGHVKLFDSYDSGNPSVNYMWRSSNIDLASKDLVIDAKVTSSEGSKENYVSFEVKPVFEEVNFGSYFPVEITVQNLKQHYVAPTFRITKAPGVYKDMLTKSMVLGPNEKAQMYWILSTPNMQDKNYIYTSEIEIVDEFNYSRSGKIKYAVMYDLYDIGFIEKLVDSLSPHEAKKELAEINISCSPTKEILYSDETTAIMCRISNAGTKNLEGIEVCLLDECKKTDLQITETKNMAFTRNFKNKGKAAVVARYNNLTMHSQFYVDVVKRPVVLIKKEADSSIGYKEKKNITIEILPNTRINNATLKINGADLIKMDELEGPYAITMPVTGKMMKKGFEIDLRYMDEIGKYYSSSDFLNMEITNMPWYARLFFF